MYEFHEIYELYQIYELLLQLSIISPCLQKSVKISWRLEKNLKENYYQRLIQVSQVNRDDCVTYNDNISMYCCEGLLAKNDVKNQIKIND